MISELEKRFFDTFGIEPKITNVAVGRGFYIEHNRVEKYPQITDRILLELILINMHKEDLFGYPTNIQELKDNTLKQLIETYDKFSTCITCDGKYQQSAIDIKHKVRTLFEEE